MEMHLKLMSTLYQANVVESCTEMCKWLLVILRCRALTGRRHIFGLQSVTSDNSVQIASLFLLLLISPSQQPQRKQLILPGFRRALSTFTETRIRLSLHTITGVFYLQGFMKWKIFRWSILTLTQKHLGETWAKSSDATDWGIRFL